uniref:Translation initiation factor eIF2B subunit delta n=2 Tax=Clastoptera arizonana TaxID=38151 RepID=A0A1B6E126_9HEMI
MAEDQAVSSISKFAKQKGKQFSINDRQTSTCHDIVNQSNCCLKNSSCSPPSDLKRSICSKTKSAVNNSCSDKQEPKCCSFKQKPEQLKQQPVKKIDESVPEIQTSNQIIEISRSKKRRLRKKKVVAIYTSKVDKNPPQAINIKSEVASTKANLPPVPVCNDSKTDTPKTLIKELRKRPDKTFLEARKKKLSAKSPPQETQVITRKVNQRESDNCNIKSNQDVSKVVEPRFPCYPRFYFPANTTSYNSKDKSKSGNNTVFYFGETKNELEGICSSKSYGNNTYDIPKQSNTIFNFNGIRNNKETTSILPPNESVFLKPRNISSSDHNKEDKRLHTITFTKPFDKEIQNSVQGIQFQLDNNKIDKINKSEPVIVNRSSGPISQQKMDSQFVKSTKSREEVLAEREAKKAAKLAAKSKHKTNTPEVVNEIAKTPTDVKVNLLNTNLTSGPIPKSRTVVDGGSALPKNVSDILGKVTDDNIPAKCNDQVDGEIRFQSDMVPTFTKLNLDSNYPKAVLDFLKTEPKNMFDESTKLVTAIGKVIAEKANMQNKVIQSEGKNEEVKSKAELRAERRAKQEAQRAAKISNKQEVIKKTQLKEEKPKAEIKTKSTTAVVKSTQHTAKLFSHLYQAKKTNLTLCETLNTRDIHPAIIRLGCQYRSRVVNGSNARCLALLHALKKMICDYKTPTEKEFSRGLESQLAPVTDYLNSCRPLSVSMTNAMRHIKWHLTQLPNDVSDVEAQKKLCEIVDTYIKEQIDVAGEAICNTVQKKIANNDVILTFGCSSLICRILVESHRSGTKFRVIVVDAGPWFEGREMLRRLVVKGLQCSYVLISATSFIMREASKVLLGAHALLANGYVMSRAGSSQVALLAHSFNVPVLVCCETHKFSERVQTDAFVYNELGDPEEFIPKEKWGNYSNLTPLSLAYDVTPPELVTAVVTELAILPCTSVPVILRIKPSESLM